MTHLARTGGSLIDPLRCHSVTHLASVPAGQRAGPLYLFSTTRHPEGHRNQMTTSPATAQRALCPSCGATPSACTSLHVLGGRHCCLTCAGDHDLTTSKETR